MKPEFNSRRLFGITRSKGKMYELNVPEEAHLVVPEGDHPEALLVLTVGNLGDAAATLNDESESSAVSTYLAPDELQFSASFFDAFLESGFKKEISDEIALLAASAYYLSFRPGSSIVVANRLSEAPSEDSVAAVLKWLLRARWQDYPLSKNGRFGEELGEIARLIAFHFYDGSGADEVLSRLRALRSRAYSGSQADELLFVDLITAITRLRLSHSSWSTLPSFSGLPAATWAPVIRRGGFPRELWPSQMRLGQAGIFAGASGVVQMPTSAGKTRSVEIVLRSALFAGSARLAVVVAPFRALCHEISASLRTAFKPDGISVNEMSDVLQQDFLNDFADFLGADPVQRDAILVVTPEKLLYVLRQIPEIVDQIGVVVYDEGHQFDTGSRGITYELLLTQIKALLPVGAQTILISAVIQNAQAIGNWLIGEGAVVVKGGGLLPTTKAYAFASWIEHLGQLMFFESTDFSQRDYFVPRAIEQQILAQLSAKESMRQFPSRKTPTETSKDVSLYLGIRLASKGACAIFCGRKDTAAGMADRIVEIYRRGYAIKPPATYANEEELTRLAYLTDKHFGRESIQSRAARLGLFVHNNNTPHGLRLAIEYAMQQKRIPLVACTSTLAQGVNLPIRYLIVSGIYQGAERIKARDFQNLVGRAGRAGIHTEGIIIFSDPSVYDNRNSRADGWRFRTSCSLLSENSSGDTTSSLLGLVAPIATVDGKGRLALSATLLCQLIYSQEEQRTAWAREIVRVNPSFKFTVEGIVGELRRRRRDIIAIESYLMANRGSADFVEFASTVETLAKATLAYSIANADQKAALAVLFRCVAEYIQLQAAIDRQVVYGRTLLGVASARRIEEWVTERRAELLQIESPDRWLSGVWPLFTELSDDKFFSALEPKGLSFQLATLWMQGAAFAEIFEYCRKEKGTKPWGEKRRAVTESDIQDFLQNTLSFECSLILASVAEFLFEIDSADGTDQLKFRFFQKSLSYGLPDETAIAAFDYGFADRMVSQDLSDIVNPLGVGGTFESFLRDGVLEVRAVLSKYPTYFETVLEGRI